MFRCTAAEAAAATEIQIIIKKKRNRQAQANAYALTALRNLDLGLIHIISMHTHTQFRLLPSQNIHKHAHCVRERESERGGRALVVVAKITNLLDPYVLSITKRDTQPSILKPKQSGVRTRTPILHAHTRHTQRINMRNRARHSSARARRTKRRPHIGPLVACAR